jgi:hypothetical protein
MGSNGQQQRDMGFQALRIDQLWDAETALQSGRKRWAILDSNQGPLPYQGLTSGWRIWLG